MKNKTLASLLVTTALVATMAGTATAQTANSGAWGVKNPLFDKVAGKLNLTANVGYVYNFDSKWDSEVGTGKANGGFGYGARIGWTNTSGFGISGDYLGFTSKWSNGTTEYSNPYHVLTITPSYRFSFGQSKEWGLKVGLGVGMSLADVSWGTAMTAKGASGKVAGGAVYKSAATETESSNMGDVAHSGVPGEIARHDMFTTASSPTATSAGGSVTCSNYFITDGFASATTIEATDICIGNEHSGNFRLDRPSGSATGVEKNKKQNLGKGGTAGATFSYGYVTRVSITDSDIVADIKAGNIVWAKDTIAASIWSAAVSTATTATEAQKVVDALKAAAASWTAGAGNFQAARATISSAVQTILDAGAVGSDVAKLKGNLAAAIAAAPVADAGGSAKDDAGFVLAPEIALEYDNGLLHADINARYIHGLANVKYDGQNGTGNQLQRSGPLAVFVGAGFGVNF